MKKFVLLATVILSACASQTRQETHTASEVKKDIVTHYVGTVTIPVPVADKIVPTPVPVDMKVITNEVSHEVVQAQLEAERKTAPDYGKIVDAAGSIMSAASSIIPGGNIGQLISLGANALLAASAGHMAVKHNKLKKQTEHRPSPS